MIPLLLLSCGSSGPDPISSGPLGGTIGGRPFTAKSARARKSASKTPNKKAISIYDVDTKCSDPTPATDRWVLVTPIWAAGAAQDPYSVAWYVKAATGGTDTIYIADSSTVEVVDAPAEVGATGTIRVRASNKGDAIEGQITVQVCE